MKAIVAVAALVVLMSAAGLMFWAMWRASALTQRLHPLTPEQRRRKRKAYVLLVPTSVVAIVLAAALSSGGTGAVVAVAILAAIVLLDAVLTPLLHYRRVRRSASHRRP